LPYQQLKFPDASTNAIGGIKQAARRAAAEKAETSPHLASGVSCNKVAIGSI